MSDQTQKAEQIILCDKHWHYQTPMIRTLAFMGAELWCPYCGNSTGWPFGEYAVEDVTEELKNRLAVYEVAARDYLLAYGIMTCVKTLWEGQWIKPEDLPQAEKDRLAAIREKGWKTEQKAEEIHL